MNDRLKSLLLTISILFLLIISNSGSALVFKDDYPVSINSNSDPYIYHSYESMTKVLENISESSGRIGNFSSIK